MKVSSVVILYLTGITCVKAVEKLHVSAQSKCETNYGFAGCECMFAGGCDAKGNIDPKKIYDVNLDGFAPQGINQFAYEKGGSENLGWVCEGGTVAILYDCNARIPLYAATVIEGNQAGKTVDRTNMVFELSSKLDPSFQQTNLDYKDSSKHTFCYKDEKTGKLQNWSDGGKCLFNEKAPINSPIHKGHMIAAGYARADPGRVRNTFFYTNCVPQFGVFNSGQWRSAEDSHLVKKWGNDVCHKDQKNQEARIYVVVGAVPTTYKDNSKFFGKPKFFGKAGFSNFENHDYRVVVPHFMWTAACCVFASDNTVIAVKAFARENLPNKDKVIQYKSPQEMIDELFPSSSINLFPANAKCMSG